VLNRTGERAKIMQERNRRQPALEGRDLLQGGGTQHVLSDRRGQVVRLCQEACSMWRKGMIGVGLA
jgi:hypothetical protein